MEHKNIRVIVNPDADGLPEDIQREQQLALWADGVHLAAMRIVAAGVKVGEGSLEKAASVLWHAEFTVPAGYFPEDREIYDLDSEEALQAWVEADAENIADAAGSVGFKIAATGGLLSVVD